MNVYGTLFVTAIVLWNGYTLSKESAQWSVVADAVTIVGGAEDRLGYAVAGHRGDGSNEVPTVAMVSQRGMHVFYGTRVMTQQIYELTVSNSLLYRDSDLMSFAVVGFVDRHNGHEVHAITHGPLTTNGTAIVNQVVALNMRDAWKGEADDSQINGTNGFRIVGTEMMPSPYPPYACADMNADGFNELVHGAFDAMLRAYAFVWYGTSDSVSGARNLDEVDGTNSFRIMLKTSPGAMILATGDFNGDGRGDIAVNTAGGLALVWGRPRYVKELCATNLALEDGVIVRNAEIGKNGGFGDINGDGVDDVLLPGGSVVFGRTNWGAAPDAALMGAGEIMRAIAPSNVSYSGTSCIGDVNGDGYDDWTVGALFQIIAVPPVETTKFCIVYGRPAYPVGVDLWNSDGTNGFGILQTSLFSTRGGDWNGDGYEEAVFGDPNAWPEGRTNAGAVYITPGRASPAWSPYVFEPVLVLEGQSKVYESEALTNIVVGRKGARHTLLTVNGQAVEQTWLGTWWTNVVVRSATSETVTVRYWTTNVISVSSPATTLVITAIPEAGWGGVAVGLFTIYELRFTIWGRGRRPRRHEDTKGWREVRMQRAEGRSN